MLIHMAGTPIFIGMYLRTTRRRNADGSVAQYRQLAENVWNSAKGCAVAKVVSNVGRADELTALAASSEVWQVRAIAALRLSRNFNELATQTPAACRRSTPLVVRLGAQTGDPRLDWLGWLGRIEPWCSTWNDGMRR